MTMARIRIESDIGHDHHLRQSFFDLPDRLKEDIAVGKAM